MFAAVVRPLRRAFLTRRLRPGKPIRRAAPLRAEPLEGRDCPALFLVNTTNDTNDIARGDGLARDANGQTSLRAAVQEANALGGSHEARFDPAFFGAGGNVTLLGKMDMFTASIAVTNPQPNGVVRFFGSGTAGMFSVYSSSTSSFSRFEFRQGVNNRAVNAAATGFGGAIGNIGRLEVRDSLFSQCIASEGGAIADAAGGTLTVMNSVITDNRIVPNGQNIYGGGVSTLGGGTTTTIIASQLTNNATDTDPAIGTRGGALAARSGGRLVVNQSIVSGNRSTNGGGIYISVGAIRMTNSFLVNNQASGSGGGIQHGGGADPLGDTFENVEVSGNTAGNWGGGIWQETHQLSLIGCAVRQNRATQGGGIYQQDGTLTLAGLGAAMTAIDRNEASGNGGGVYLQTGTLRGNAGTEFTGNSAHDGGGVYQEGGTSTFNQVSFRGNSVTGMGGAVYFGAGSMSLDFCPINETNVAGQGGYKIAYKTNPPALANMMWWIFLPEHLVRDTR